MHESMLAFRKRRYLWLALLITGLCIAAYWIDDPQEPATYGDRRVNSGQEEIAASPQGIWRAGHLFAPKPAPASPPNPQRRAHRHHWP